MSENVYLVTEVDEEGFAQFRPGDRLTFSFAFSPAFHQPQRLSLHLNRPMTNYTQQSAFPAHQQWHGMPERSYCCWQAGPFTLEGDQTQRTHAK